MTLRNAVLLCLLLPTLSQAGDSKGNGGDVVVCRDSAGKVNRIELLDFYEASQLWSIKYHFKESTLAGKIEEALTKLEAIDSFRANLFRSQVKTFYKEANFIPGIKLIDIPDSKHVAMPSKDCLVEQIAIQREPQFIQDRRYLINKDLWDLLDDDHRAGLVLHELIFRNALEGITTDSRGSRYLNSLVTSDEITKLTLEEYLDAIKRAQFLTYTKSGVELTLNYDHKFSASGNLIEGFADKLGFLMKRGSKVRYDRSLTGFFDSGQIKYTKAIHESTLFFGNRSCTSNGEFGRVEWYENDNVKSVQMPGACNWMAQELTVLDLAVTEPVYFFPSGKIKAALTSRTKTWMTTAGQIKIPPQTEIELNEAGIVIKW